MTLIAEVRRVLSERPNAVMSYDEVHALVGGPRSSFPSALDRLVQRGQAERVSPGRFRHATPRVRTPRSALSLIDRRRAAAAAAMFDGGSYG